MAFYRGVAREGDLLRASFADVVRHQARVLGKQWTFGMVQVWAACRGWRRRRLRWPCAVPCLPAWPGELLFACPR